MVLLAGKVIPTHIGCFFRLGLDFIEHEQLPAEQEKTIKRYARFDLRSRQSEPVDNIKSQYGVRFRSIASADEEQLGIRGRQVDVFEISSGKVIATRKEFFGRHPDFSRAAATGVCPPTSGWASDTNQFSVSCN
jgi:hypothetical protein